MDTNQFHFIAGKIFGLQQSLHKLVLPTHIFILKLNAFYHGTNILANKFIHLYVLHELTNGINSLLRLIAYLQVRIQDLVKGGGPASEAESCQHSEAELRERSEHSAAGVQGPLKGPGSFWVFDAQICILTHSRDSFSLIFDIYFDTKS